MNLYTSLGGDDVAGLVSGGRREYLKQRTACSGVNEMAALDGSL